MKDDFDELLQEAESPVRKKPKRISPTQLSLKWFRARGIASRVTERWVKTLAGGFRLDLWGADIQCLMAREVLNVQAGAASSHAAKVAHAMNHPDVRKWLAVPSCRMWVMTWGKRVAFKKDGTRKKLPAWTPRVTAIELVAGVMISKPVTLFAKRSCAEAGAE